MNIINPANNTLITSVIEDDRITVSQKLSYLKVGQTAWAAISLKERIKILQKYAEVLQNKIPVSKSIGPGPAAYNAKFEV